MQQVSSELSIKMAANFTWSSGGFINVCIVSSLEFHFAQNLKSSAHCLCGLANFVSCFEIPAKAIIKGGGRTKASVKEETSTCSSK